MPNWKTHLEIAKKINKKINFKESDFNLFLLGNILPDINNCFIVKEISKKNSHAYTHFNSKELPSYLNFSNKYAKLIKHSPLALGYYVHLYVDYIFNNDFYSKFNAKNTGVFDRNELARLKQKNFKVYNNNFITNTLLIDDYQQAIKEIKKIEEVSITENDLSAVLNFLNGQQKIENIKLEFYTIKKLDELMERTIKEIESKIELE